MGFYFGLGGGWGPFRWSVPLTRRRRRSCIGRSHRTSNATAVVIVLSVIGMCFVVPLILVFIGMLSGAGR